MNGEVKVRSSTDFAVKRLCTPGVKHIKAPSRRFPRDVELIGGRLQKEDIFLLHLAVSHVAGNLFKLFKGYSGLYEKALLLIRELKSFILQVICMVRCMTVGPCLGWGPFQLQ